MTAVNWGGTTYDDRHGGPFDRGSADSYYRRSYRPHYYIGGTHSSPLVMEAEMTQDDLDAYQAGFEYNEWMGNHKEW